MLLYNTKILKMIIDSVLNIVKFIFTLVDNDQIYQMCFIDGDGRTGQQALMKPIEMIENKANVLI